MPVVQVRPAELADIPAITDIYRPAVLRGTASFELEPPSEEEMARRFGTITSQGYPYLVAEGEGTGPLGYAYAGPYRTRPAYRFTVENSVYVAPGSHRRGVGRLLLAGLVAECTDRGFRQMIAIIGDSGEAASIGLHRSLGFTFCGVIHSVGLKHGRWLDSVIMQRALGDGDRSLPEPGR